MARILYIDDDEGLCQLMRRAMRRRGETIETASSGQAGLDLLKSDSFDLVAVDHYMPGMDGLDTLKAIRELSHPPPVVYVTGSEEGQVAVAALKAGAADYIVKSADDNFIDLLQSTFSQVLESRRLANEKADAEQQLRVSNERLAALLQEANHRVANSLQIVSSLVRMQASSAQSEDVRAALRDTEQRIAAVSQVHRRLYSSENVGTVEMSDYLRSLLKEVEVTWSDPKTPHPVEFTSEPVRLPTDQAVSMGVLVSELVTNSFKYAYPAGTSGPIRVDLKANGSGFTLSVEDEGQGFEEGCAPKGTGTGTKLLKAMAVSLGATMSQDTNGSGCRILVRT
ncbi:response regulator [Fulvimarina sp. MAC3]|uniref:sensor histidine kinase n=1 Tax=Fulvimarina sp. MAC3 TaxID=3148887 RepID=UPI0031FD6C59